MQSTPCHHHTKTSTQKTNKDTDSYNYLFSAGPGGKICLDPLVATQSPNPHTASVTIPMATSPASKDCMA